MSGIVTTRRIAIETIDDLKSNGIMFIKLINVGINRNEASADK